MRYASFKPVQAVATACIVTREATRRTFTIHVKALVALDVLFFIGGDCERLGRLDGFS